MCSYINTPGGLTSDKKTTDEIQVVDSRHRVGNTDLLQGVHPKTHYGTGEIPASRPGKLIEPGLVCFRVICGISLMVKLHPSKLVSSVRF